jgi:hypothetical protein
MQTFNKGDSNMKAGDKVKCIEYDAKLVVGGIYTLCEVPPKHLIDQTPGKTLVAIDHGSEVYSYWSSSFELVHEKTELDTIKELSLLAESFVGKEVTSGHGKNWKVDSYKVFVVEESAIKSSATVYGHFNTHGYCVAVTGAGRSVPVEQVTLVPTSKTIQLTDDYEAVISKDHVIVGCQTINRAKILELYKAMQAFQ